MSIAHVLLVIDLREGLVGEFVLKKKEFTYTSVLNCVGVTFVEIL
jgi:hypothetical protein